MATLLHNQIPAAVTAFLESYDRGRYTDISRLNQHSIFAMYFQNGARRQKSKALSYTFNYMDSGYSNVRYKPIDAEDSYNRSNIGAKGSVSIGFQDTHFLVNATEPSFNGGGETEIINYLHYEVQNMYDRFYEEADRRLFQLVTQPNDGSGAIPVQPHALTYWLTPAPSNTEGGFVGTNPSGYSLTGNIDRDVTTGLKNYAFTFTSMSPDDGLRRLFLAMAQTKFRPYYTVSSRNASEITAQRRFQLFSDITTFADYRQNSFGMNENFGSDIGKFQKNTDEGVWASVPWVWVPDDSLNSTRMLLGLDLSTWELITYGDWFMKRSAPVTLDQSSHLQVVTNMDSAWTTVCRNPRCNFYGSIAT